MKKVAFFATILMVLVACMVSCTNSSEGVDIPVDVTTTTPSTGEVIVAPELPELPELSKEFINTALQFIDEYPNSSKEFGNLATEAILQSNELREDLYSYLNYYLIKEHGEEIRQFFGSNASGEVYDVDTWIHNYEVGGTTYCVSFNGGPAILSSNNPLLLSAGVLGTYPDNITLAEARITSYVLLNMDVKEVEHCCIKSTSEGKEFYDFSFKNEAFRDASKEILESLLES